ncbi:Hypothetical predicted protein [Scomber scombrus]|uniref:Uncharacterized protein n=1 Tax=Scomber scombrus TaxID=13677 RepID=A0AAV1P172_SCOSC
MRVKLKAHLRIFYQTFFKTIKDFFLNPQLFRHRRLEQVKTRFRDQQPAEVKSASDNIQVLSGSLSNTREVPPY